MPAADGPSVSLSFANNFWGKDDAGVHPLLERMSNAKLTCDELKSFYNSRAAIEEEYARKLLALCRKPLGSQETGSLRSSMDTLRGEVEQMAKSHQSIAAQMKTELEEPLAAFAGSMKERRKIVQNGIEKLLKTKVQQTNQVNKTRDRYEQECLKIKGYLAQGHMVMGQEERKNKAKLEKTQINLATSNTEYENAVKILEETTGRWNRDWKIAADKFQDLEEERLDFTKSSLWTFANIASTVCVSDDGSCEKIRLSLENCEVEKDIMSFIKDRGTGQEIPDPPKYINFARGDLNDTLSETSEDENYSVAQFPRTINPSYRTSSPQPSTYESHHDPNSSLAHDFGHGEPEATPGRDNYLAPQKTPKALTDRSRQTQVDNQQQMGRQQYGQPQPLRQPDIPQQPLRHQLTDPAPQQQIESQPQPARHQLYDRPVQALESQRPTRQQFDRSQQQRQPQLENQARQNRIQYDQPQKGQVSVVPHDPYPMDGMTMLCRTDAPSERSSAPSPNRPSSRDSQSEYSNPTSFSSQEPPSGKQSPIKQDVVLAPVPERTLQKKKSIGFFQAKSPFRRKSRHEKDGVLTSPESHRNTWSSGNQNTPNHKRQAYSQDTQNNNLSTGRGSGSPELIDPRASYQLNIGNNVFDVAAPDRRGKNVQRVPAPEQEDMDPIAQALAELKGVNKQSSVRMSADHYHGIATPAPGASRPVVAPMMSGALTSGMRGTPPPSYDQPVQRLGLPQPAFTSKAMQQSTQKFVNQKQDIFSNANRPEQQQQQQQQHRGSVSQSRPGTRGSDMPRATSPIPPRGTSPRPIMQNPRQTQNASPSSYVGSPRSPSQYQGSPRTPLSGTPQQRGSALGYYNQNSSNVNSPSEPARAVSPAPFREQQSRPGSSHVGSDMAIQLAPDNDGYGGSPSQYGGSQYGGSQRGRENVRPSSGNARPMSYFNGQPGGGGQLQMAPSTRQRSKSVVDGRQFTREGRPIIHFAKAMYMYKAAIPEELSFAKGDTLAVLRLQEDGWWEAEIAGKIGRPGLVPSNYLQKI